MAAMDDEGTSASNTVSDDVIERDIDGLPLRDGLKVDLKAILGHCPQVDDDEEEEEVADDDQQTMLSHCPEEFSTVEIVTDDNEAGEEEEEMDEEGGATSSSAALLLLRQRRSSLRTTQHHGSGGGEAPDSPTGERKAVRFADSLGIGLESIRDVGVEEEPPEIPHSALAALKARRQQRADNGNKTVLLVPTFETPDAAGGGGDDEAAFSDRLADRGVLLESCFVCSWELTVSGVVRVAEAVAAAGGEKTVTVRYTTDAWTSHRDIPASYVPNSSDRFVFIIHLPETPWGEGGEHEKDVGSGRLGRLQFAVAFQAGQDDIFWDNNGGGNYVIDCVIRSREPSISEESESPAAAAAAKDAHCDQAIGGE